MDKAIGAAIMDAIHDAVSSYDDADAKTLCEILDWWMDYEIPETVGDKALNV